METEEITKLVDGIYKNILEKFNPGARQLINAGKAYLKALHGAAAASRLYVEAIGKLARQAQQGAWGSSSDIGSALAQVVEVYKEIQNQQMNILKAFYVDLLVPLETNLEKDTKVVQSEQKRFLQQHKQRSETYSKAAATMKKQRKKNKASTKAALAIDKELKNMQVLEEEKTKLDVFCEQSLKTAMTQERRRYGFVLERQCSLAKHCLAFHSLGGAALQRSLDVWQEVAATREVLPHAVEGALVTRLRHVSFWGEEDPYARPRSLDGDGGGEAGEAGDLGDGAEGDAAEMLSLASQLRKTRSMDASCLDVRCMDAAAAAAAAPGPGPPPRPLARAKSDFNLAASTHSLTRGPASPTRPKSLAAPAPSPSAADAPLARAIYAYLSSGDNQLSFLEGDVIALIGERNKGWQFGENLRTQASGWFPLAYTELLLDEPSDSPRRGPGGGGGGGEWGGGVASRTNGLHGASPASSSSSSGATGQLAGKAPVTMFGDTLLLRATSRKAPRGTATSAKAAAGAGLGSPPPPPQPAPAPTPTQLPLPVPAPRVPPAHPLAHTLPAAARGGAGGGAGGGAAGAGVVGPPPTPPPLTLLGGSKQRAAAAAAGAGAHSTGSLHSSNDSGFSNEAPPPQPEVDYSDDEGTSPNRATTASPSKKKLLSSVRGWLLYKSALDLWDDVNQQQQAPLQPYAMATLPPKKSALTGSAGAGSGPRPGALRQASSVGHLATLGRLSLAKSASASQDALASPRAQPAPAPPPAPAPAPDPAAGDGFSGSLIKRSKSLWKLVRPKDNLLEGMSLWQHRSLVDVPAALEAEAAGGGGGKERSLPRTPPRAPSAPVFTRGHAHTRPARRDDHDGLLLPRQSLSSEAGGPSSTASTASDGDSGGDCESCLVVDDHLRAASLQRRRGGAAGAGGAKHQQQGAAARKVRRAQLDGGTSPDSDGLLHYGRTLQQRMRKPERGSRFDQRSETTGNRCGPWYDLWGADASVRR